MHSFRQVDCFKMNLKVWKFLGVYPLAVSRPLLYAFYSKVFIFLSFIMYSTLFTVNLYFIPKNFDDYIEELIFYFTVLCIMCKVLTFSLNKEKIKNIIKVLESDIFQPDFEEGIKIINRAKSVNQQYWKVYTAVCTTSNLVHVLSPLLNHLILKAELLLPVCSYSFLSDEIRHTFLYPLYLYQSIGMHFHVLAIVNIDNFFVGLMIFLIAQLKIIEHRLINVTEICRNEKPAQTDEELIIKLNNIFLNYGEMTKFCYLIENVFSFSVFVQFSMGSYIICMCLIRFTMAATWQYFIFLSTYTFAMFVQIYIPCWFGNRIMDKSCQLSKAIYNCDWIPRSKLFKTNMRLFVERTNRPLSITGWKMFPLSLMTFSSIMNTAYSFFTLLRHMQSR